MNNETTVDLYVEDGSFVLIQSFYLKLFSHFEGSDKVRIVVTMCPNLTTVSDNKKIPIEHLKIAAVEFCRQFASKQLGKKVEEIGVLDCLSGAVVMEIKP